MFTFLYRKINAVIDKVYMCKFTVNNVFLMLLSEKKKKYNVFY